MAERGKPMRQSDIPANARSGETEGRRGDHPLAPFLAIVGASLPWLVYDALIKSPEEFWTVKGWIVLAAVAVGVVLFGLSWHFSRGLPDRDG
jgi:hypothetical protein